MHLNLRHQTGTASPNTRIWGHKERTRTQDTLQCAEKRPEALRRDQRTSSMQSYSRRQAASAREGARRACPASRAWQPTSHASSSRAAALNPSWARHANEVLARVLRARPVEGTRDGKARCAHQTMHTTVVMRESALMT